jgi:hypothetical protein
MLRKWVSPCDGGRGPVHIDKGVLSTAQVVGVMVVNFLKELAKRMPFTDIGMPCNPQPIVLISDACPTLRRAFEDWHGFPVELDAVTWTTTEVWGAFVAQVLDARC